MRVSAIIGFAVFAAAAQAQSIPGRTLLWSDEFDQTDGTAPDPSKWSYDIGGGGWGNNELQYYTNRTDNVRVEAGQLVIEAKAENYGGRNYTSGRLLTKGKASWTYGRMEARIKIPKGKGIWPAFWLLGANVDTAHWPDCGEIDIMENIGSEPSTLHGTLHGPGYSGAAGITGDYHFTGGALSDDYHIYAIEWEESRISWFIDGQQYFSLTSGNLPAGRSWIFSQPQFLLLNLAVGGNWPGNPNATTVFPQRMSVDYVRVYSPLVAAAGADITVLPDPSEAWLGYMNVYDLPSDGGSFRSGQTWATNDLDARFTDSKLVLKPNSIQNTAPYWYIGGGAPGHPGNKIMKASLYVQNEGSLSGRNVIFTGNVISNSLTGAHDAVAFIKDFSPDYATHTTVTAPLTEGPFNIHMTTAAGSGRHVQYGFQMSGVNVWSTDLVPFGSVEIAAVTPDPFETWMAGIDFSGTENADQSPTGDPDGDGRTNFEEFAFDGNPASGASTGKSRARIEFVVGAKAFVLTVPIRKGAVFTGSPGKSATVGKLSYAIEGSTGLDIFDRGVTEIAASASGLPILHPGWSYRSFRLNGEIDSSSAGFLRVRVGYSP